MVGITIVGPPTKEDSYADALRTENSIAAIRRSVELGCNFIDTAAEYGSGYLEEVVGRALKCLRREDLFIATKGGRVTGGDGRPRTDQRPASILRHVDDSLKRLGTDWIDLYQLHGQDLETGTPVEDSWETMVKLKQQGKAHYIGVCDFDLKTLVRCESIHHVDTSQSPYNLLRREVETDILPWCIRQGVGVIVYSPMHFGLLSGSFAPCAIAEADWRRGNPWFDEPELSKYLTFVERLRPIAARQGKTVGQLAIAWTLANPAVFGAVVGARNPAQAEQNLGAMGWQLSDIELAEIETAYHESRLGNEDEQR